MTAPAWLAAMWANSVAKRGVGGTLRAWTMCALAGILLALAAYGLARGSYYAWQARRHQDAAATAEQAAAQSEARADRAETGAVIESDTRAGMDAIRVEVTLPAEQSARRIEDATPAAGDEPVSDDVMRELREGEAGYRSAAGRLQRTRAR